MIQHFTGSIDSRHFHTGAQTGVQTDGGTRPGRSRQQQVFQVTGKHVDGRVVGLLAQASKQVGFQVRVKLDPPGPAQHFPQPGIRRTPLIVNSQVIRQHQFTGVNLGIRLAHRNAEP